MPIANVYVANTFFQNPTFHTLMNIIFCNIQHVDVHLFLSFQFLLNHDKHKD